MERAVTPAVRQPATMKPSTIHRRSRFPPFANMESNFPAEPHNGEGRSAFPAAAYYFDGPEPIPFRLNRNGAQSFCFDACSSREPVSTPEQVRSSVPPEQGLPTAPLLSWG